MEDLLTFELIKGAYVPIMGLMFFLSGYIATDKLFLQDCILFLDGKKSRAVFLAGLPIGLLYYAFGTYGWESILGTYLITNGLYDLIFKYLKQYLP